MRGKLTQANPHDGKPEKSQIMLRNPSLSSARKLFLLVVLAERLIMM